MQGTAFSIPDIRFAMQGGPGMTTSLFHKAYHAGTCWSYVEDHTNHHIFSFGSGLMELPDAFWLQARHVLFPEKAEALWQI